MQLLYSKFVIITTKNTIEMKLNGTYKIQLFLVFASFLFNGCDEFFNCIDGNGILKQERRFVSEFYGVENTTSIDVDISSDSVYSLEVTADENLLGMIQTTVRNGNLVISMSTDRCINTDNYMLIEIQMPTIDHIESTGSGNMDIYDFECGNLEITNSGSGKIDMINVYSGETVGLNLYGSGSIYIGGKARVGEYVLSGSGDIMADDLMVDDCYVTNSGSGTVYCFAYDYLKATLSGSGDIIYSGNPPVTDFTDSGSGEIRSRTN